MLSLFPSLTATFISVKSYNLNMWLGFFLTILTFVFQEYDCWCLTLMLGGGGGCIFTPILSKWFISDLGKTILYFRNDFQNLAAEQKQNHAAPYHTTPVVLRNVAHSTKGKLPEIVWGLYFIQKPLVYFSIKISSKTDLIFAMLFDLYRAVCSANTWLLDEQRLTRLTLQKQM